MLLCCCCCCCCATTQGAKTLRDLCINLTKALGAVSVKALEEIAVLEFAEQNRAFLCRFKLLLTDAASSQPGKVSHHCCNRHFGNCHCCNRCCSGCHAAISSRDSGSTCSRTCIAETALAAVPVVCSSSSSSCSHCGTAVDHIAMRCCDKRCGFAALAVQCSLLWHVARELITL
eukprot:9853-Heterococcus_DN1.PRE.3